MSKHTQGPWVHCARLSGSENHKGFYIKAHRFVVAYEVIPVDSDGKEGEANARLIAAAPEMIQMLIDLRDELRMFYSDEEPYNNPRLNEVIAKATGESE